MKKRIQKVLSLVLVMLLLGSSNVWASVLAAGVEMSDDTNEIQPRSR